MNSHKFVNRIEDSRWFWSIGKGFEATCKHRLTQTMIVAWEKKQEHDLEENCEDSVPSICMTKIQKLTPALISHNHALDPLSDP